MREIGIAGCGENKSGQCALSRDTAARFVDQVEDLACRETGPRHDQKMSWHAIGEQRRHDEGRQPQPKQREGGDNLAPAPTRLWQPDKSGL